VCGSRFTPAAEYSKQKAQVRASAHQVRRDKHTHKQVERALMRLHEGAWLQASHERMQAVQQRVRQERLLQRQAVAVEQARITAERRQEAAQELARKESLAAFARDQADMARAAVRLRTVQVLTNEKAAIHEAGKLVREHQAFERQRLNVACDGMKSAFAALTHNSIRAITT